MRISISIVIPAYNASATIIALLSSVYHSKKVDFSKIEVIVVDDCSKDETVRLIQKFILRHKRLYIKIVSLGKNSGPAHARNVGAKEARGKILFFLDSDVVLLKNSLFELFHSFEDPDIHALTGVWDKKQKRQAFFPKFKALRDWSYWINERDPKNYYYLFSTRVAAIDRDLFLRLGGFDDSYKTALVEDIELTYRIAKRYAVVFNPRVIVHHEFESFMPIAQKYFWRSFYWSKIYRERKKFDPVATTSKEAITTITAALLVIVVFLTLILRLTIYDIRLMNKISLFFILNFLSLILFLIHVWGVRKFLWFCFKKEGFIFSMMSFITGYILYLVILSGAFFSFLYFFIGTKKGR